MPIEIIFAELATQRNELSALLEKTEARRAAVAQCLDPKSTEEKLQAVYAAAEETITSPDLEPTEKQALLSRVVSKIIPLENGVKILMKPESSGIVHVVLFKWSEAATPEKIDAALEALRGMQGQIEGLIDLTCGANFSTRAQGFTHGLVVRLVDKAALETYATHPVHVAVVERFIAPIKGDILALDYEF